MTNTVEPRDLTSNLIQPSVRILAYSVTESGDEVLTGEAWIHRFVLAELNTHRVLSKNSASSRAIPIAKQIEMLRQNVAYPVVWATEQRGMQGGEPLDEEATVLAKNHWALLLQSALRVAGELRELGLHKSLTNRLLEPWMYHRVVLTGTAFENFYRQRDHADAQPEIAVVARALREAHQNAVPTLLRDGEWHLPYVSKRDRHNVQFRAAQDIVGDPVAASVREVGVERTLARISAARCARTSYLTNPVVDASGQVVSEAKVDLNKDLDLYDRLVGNEPRHWSPLEHPCTPWAANRQSDPLAFAIGDRLHFVTTDHLPRVGNLLGYRSLRTETETLLNEVTFR